VEEDAVLDGLMAANAACVMADQCWPCAPPGGRTLALAWLVRQKGSKEGGDVTAPSISRSLALALLLSRWPSETERHHRRHHEFGRART